MRVQRDRRESNKAQSYHRLRDASVAERIVASTGLAPPSLVFEPGAGDGILTAALRERARKVVAIEIDRVRWTGLRSRFLGDPRVEPVLGDMLAFAFPSRAEYAVVSNLPFGVTAEFLRRLQRLPNPPRDAFLVMQREAAARWLGTGAETVASVTLKTRFESRIALALRRSDFTPRPSVDCVLVHLERRPRPLIPPAAERAFEAFVRREFGAGKRARPPRDRSVHDWVHNFSSAAPRRNTREAGL